MLRESSSVLGHSNKWGHQGRPRKRLCSWAAPVMKPYGLRWLKQPEAAIILRKNHGNSALKTMASDKHKGARRAELAGRQERRFLRKRGVGRAQKQSRLACSFQRLQLCCSSFVCSLLWQLPEGRAEQEWQPPREPQQRQNQAVRRQLGAAGRNWMQQVRSSKENAAPCAARRDRLRHESRCVPLALWGCWIYKPPAL